MKKSKLSNEEIERLKREIMPFFDELIEKSLNTPAMKRTLKTGTKKSPAKSVPKSPKPPKKKS